MAAAQLEHPHIVDVHGIGCERGVHFYVMRFIEGQTLAQVIEALRSAERGARSAEQDEPSATPTRSASKAGEGTGDR